MGCLKTKGGWLGVLVFLIVGVMLGSIIAGTSITNDWRLDSAKQNVLSLIQLMDILSGYLNETRREIFKNKSSSRNIYML